MTEGYLVHFSDHEWINADLLEQTLPHPRHTGNTPLSKGTTLTFVFPPSCKVMVDAAARLLSLANQLAAAHIPVVFSFEGERHEALSYLHRASFFSLLAGTIQVLPVRPDPASVERYQGQSSRLIEFQALDPRHYEAVANVPSQLADALETALGDKMFEQTPFTLFTELINNVYDHSLTELAGCVACQVYQKRVQIVVSDSGIGLLATLRPKLLSLESRNLAESELLCRLFDKKLDWRDSHNGQGLQGCAKRSLKYRGQIDIRLERSRIVLYPSSTGYQLDKVHSAQGLFPIKGTHICFSFPLDRSQ